MIFVCKFVNGPFVDGAPRQTMCEYKVLGEVYNSRSTEFYFKIPT